MHRLGRGRGGHRRLLRLAARLVDHLYIRPECHGQGLGTALLGKAMAEHSPLRLWAFQRNTRALRFYAARGFRVIERTDGSRN
jgi:GNAT superfamily N-acetyltransferase